MLTVKPFPYQNAAIDKALDRGNLLIAYGMGLGKTLVQIAICEELLGQDEVTLNAIVVPASLKWQWAQALVWATDVQSRDIRVKGQRITVPMKHHAVVIDGSPQKRDEDYAYIRKYRPDYVVLGYENVVNDARQVRRIKPDLIAGDEITAIKSFNAERSLAFKEWDAPYRYGLTGTPIDNRPEELYSIMEWISPGELGHFKHFDRAYIVRDGYGRPKRYKNLDVLHQKTKSFVARKTRFDPDVAPFMPKDVHLEFYSDLTGKARDLYKVIAAELIEHLQQMSGWSGFDLSAYYTGTGQQGGTAEQGDAMARFGAMSMLCDHPQLLLDSARRFEEWFAEAMEIDAESAGQADLPPVRGSKYAWQLLQAGELDWITDKVTSPKFEDSLEKIHDILDEREENKVIVFSFSKKMLRLFRNRLGAEQCVIFDGDMNSGEKEAAKQKFKKSPKVRVFLSSDAGGMGVDLPEANYLINYNHPWSAGKADQRNSRHVRAGSAWDQVWVLNYIVKGSVEEWKFNVLETKRKVGSAILDGGPTKQGVITFDAGSLLEWLLANTV